MKKTTILALILALAAGGAMVLPLSAQNAPDVPMMPHGTYLGVDTRDVTKDRVAELKLKEESGVEVTMVDRDAPAGVAGVQEHDVIVSFNGGKVESQEALRRFVRETPAGREVALGLVRNGQPLTVKVTLADRREVAQKFAPRAPQSQARNNPPQGMPGAQGFMGHAPEMPLDVPGMFMSPGTVRLGMVIEGLTPQLAEYFGAKNGAGVLVRSVDKGSPAEAAGLRAGDVVLRIDKEAINDIGDWRKAMHHRSGQVPLTVLREKKELTLNVKLPERKAQVDGKDFPELPDKAEISRLMEELGPQVREAQHQAEQAMAAHRDEMERAMKALREQPMPQLPDFTLLFPRDNRI